MLGGLVGRTGSHRRFQSVAAHGQRCQLELFGSFVFGTPGFPLSDVPLQDIARQVAEGKLDAKPARVFSFDQIHEAHRVMESGKADGKMVVVLD